jgi:hypothetical protein
LGDIAREGGIDQSKKRGPLPICLAPGFPPRTRRRDDIVVSGAPPGATFPLTSAADALHRHHPEAVLGPRAICERVGLFAFSRILDMGRPPPDVETGSPAALGLIVEPPPKWSV